MSNYTFIVTKIKAMQKNLIKDDEYKKLSGLQSLHELIDFLKSHPTYSKHFENMNTAIIHRSEIERRLYRAYNEDFSRIYKVSNLEIRKFLKVFAIDYVILFIKKSIHALYRDTPSDIDFNALHSFFKKYSNIDPEKLQEATNLKDLIDALSDSEFYEPLKQIYENNGDDFIHFETYLDSFFFNKIWSCKNKTLNVKDFQYVKNIYGTSIDLINIMTIYRSKKYYNLSDSNILPFLVPINYRLTKDEINSMVHSENIDECVKAISKTKYSKLTENLDKRTIGAICSELIYSLQKRFVKRYAYSIASIGSYFYFRKQEILYLISITEGLRYNIGQKEINKYLHKY